MDEHLELSYWEGRKEYWSWRREERCQELINPCWKSRVTSQMEEELHRNNASSGRHSECSVFEWLYCLSVLCTIAVTDIQFYDKVLTPYVHLLWVRSHLIWNQSRWKGDWIGVGSHESVLSDAEYQSWVRPAVKHLFDLMRWPQVLKWQRDCERQREREVRGGRR